MKIRTVHFANVSLLLLLISISNVLVFECFIYFLFQNKRKLNIQNNCFNVFNFLNHPFCFICFVNNITEEIRHAACQEIVYPKSTKISAIFNPLLGISFYGLKFTVAFY